MELGLKPVSDPPVLLLFVLWHWQHVLTLQAGEIHAGDQGLYSVWWDRWKCILTVLGQHSLAASQALRNSCFGIYIGQEVSGSAQGGALVSEWVWRNEWQSLCKWGKMAANKWLRCLFEASHTWHYPARTILVGSQNCDSFIHHLQWKVHSPLTFPGSIAVTR